MVVAFSVMQIISSERKLPRTKILIEARNCDNPQAKEDESRAFDQVAEWFAEDILEQAKARAIRKLSRKQTRGNENEVHECSPK